LRKYRGAEESARAPSGLGANRARALYIVKAGRDLSFAKGPNQISREDGKRRIVVTRQYATAESFEESAGAWCEGYLPDAPEPRLYAARRIRYAFRGAEPR
jgi:hypothetical protein